MKRSRGIQGDREKDTTWCPRETAFRMQRLILQRYFSGDEDDKCMICLDTLVQKIVQNLPCKHVFHYNCWQILVERQTYTCPLCRVDFSEALPAVGIVQTPTGPPVENAVVLTIFTNLELYDFMLELLWRSYQRDLEREDD